MAKGSLNPASGSEGPRTAAEAPRANSDREVVAYSPCLLGTMFPLLALREA